MEQLLFSSVETLPNARASVAFTEPKPVFKEDGEVTPTILSDTHSYMPWGATNQMPFDIIDLIESDETYDTPVFQTDGVRFSSKEEQAMRA